MRLHVALGEYEGIIDREEVLYVPDGSPIKDIAVITRVGKPICFHILGFERGASGLTVRLSRRSAQEECYRNHISRLRPGDILPATVTHLESFGAFVDIGCGISSLLSVDALSVSRISHPGDRLSCGMTVYTVVRTVDPLHHRVFVSQRELLGTWEENAARFSAGQTVAGIVRSVERYGVFIELAPNLAGLAELREDARSHPELTVGYGATVYIKSIIPERMKIKLVLIDTYSGPRTPTPRKYYINPTETGHIDRWRYSPPDAPKVIETVFTEEE
jgi:small subunit ribosomal protein S1